MFGAFLCLFFSPLFFPEIIFQLCSPLSPVAIIIFSFQKHVVFWKGKIMAFQKYRFQPENNFWKRVELTQFQGQENTSKSGPKKRLRSPLDRQVEVMPKRRVG